MAEATGAPQPALLTIRQAAALLSLGRTTIYSLIAIGELEVIHIGRSVRVPRDAVSEFVERRRKTAAAQRQ